MIRFNILSGQKKEVSSRRARLIWIQRNEKYLWQLSPYKFKFKKQPYVVLENLFKQRILILRILMR